MFELRYIGKNQCLNYFMPRRYILRSLSDLESTSLSLFSLHTHHYGSDVNVLRLNLVNVSSLSLSSESLFHVIIIRL